MEVTRAPHKAVLFALPEGVVTFRAGPLLYYFANGAFGVLNRGECSPAQLRRPGNISGHHANYFPASCLLALKGLTFVALHSIGVLAC